MLNRKSAHLIYTAAKAGNRANKEFRPKLASADWGHMWTYGYSEDWVVIDLIE